MTKEEIFDKYDKSLIDDSDLIRMLDELQLKDVKTNGVVYTPLYIVREIIKIANPSFDETIIEPSCGHGAFILELIHYISKKYNKNGVEIKKWFISKVKGIDISENTIDDLKDILVHFFRKHYQVESKKEEFNNLICADSLLLPTENCNVVIGNPPYIRARNLDEDYLKTIKKNFKYCEKGNIDIYYAFVEKYQKMADRLCFIIPNSFLTNVSGKAFTSGIISDLELLIDFKDKIIFNGIRAYTCILSLNKNKNTKLMQYSNSITEKPVNMDSSILLNNFKNPKLDITIIAELATLANSLYTVKLINNKFYAKYEDSNFEIESELIRPFLKVTKVKNNKIEDMDFIIYPYDKNVKALAETVLEEKYPLAYKYLNIIKPKLNMRDKGKVEKYEQWYAYGRKQGFYSGKLNKVISIPKIIGEKCLPQIIDLTEYNNKYGEILITSGFIIPYDKSLDILLKDDFLKYVKQNGKVWPGKTEPYYAVSAKNIKTYLIDRTID